MSRYAFTFNLNTTAMKNDGMTPSQITTLYQTTIPVALGSCGFAKTDFETFYSTPEGFGSIACLMRLRDTLRDIPEFGRYLVKASVLRVDETSNVTSLFSA